MISPHRFSNESYLSKKKESYQYRWPHDDLLKNPSWLPLPQKKLMFRELLESSEELESDSRWPALFPSPICIVTAKAADGSIGIEKVVGPSIVNRFPFVVALSFCHQELSKRHYPRDKFISLIESAKSVSIQFISPGEELKKILDVINEIPDSDVHERIKKINLPLRNGVQVDAPSFEDAYLVYEAKLVRSQKDFSGDPIFDLYYKDLGSHKVYFFEITTIQLSKDIAEGKQQIHWCSLPFWKDQTPLIEENKIIKSPSVTQTLDKLKYIKSYSPNYIFPSVNTIAFKFDEYRDSMAVRYLPALPKDQVEIDNDLARWPCFFPSSLGLITAWSKAGNPTALPCGSTTVLSRSPFVISICLSYSDINERYAKRDSLEIILKNGRFGCGVPIINSNIIEAISYLGNVSYKHNPNKFYNSGLHLQVAGETPIIEELPIHFDCKVFDKIRLGTHFMILGKVEKIFIRDDVSVQNPLIWCPWAEVVKGIF